MQEPFAQLRASSAVVVATSGQTIVEHAVADLRSQLQGDNWAQIIVFFAPDMDSARLAAALVGSFPDIPVCGCSTAGTITPDGFSDDALLAIGFGRSDFTVACSAIEDVSSIAFERACQTSLQLRAEIRRDADPAQAEGYFGLLLVDGVSNGEERLLAALGTAVHDVSLIGGSAGDGLSFRKTTLIRDGKVLRDAAILMLFRTSLAFKTFRTQNFRPTGTKLVVTSADVERRTVFELNAEPAASEYAACIGILPADLNPAQFAMSPIALKAATDCYCRSIRNVNQDGSLTFYCAIDEGLVLTVTEPVDLVDSTRAALETLEDDLGELGVILGFECILRRLDAESRQVKVRLEQLYKDYGVIGFHTYGEQFNAVHLNQTLTGIAIGSRRKAADGLL